MVASGVPGGGVTLYDQPWMLKAHLDDREPVAEMRKAS